MSYIGNPDIGLTGTNNYGTDDRVLEIKKLVTTYDRESAPLMTWLSHTRGRMYPTSNEDFSWMELQFDYTKFEVTLGLTGGALTENVTIASPEVIVGDTFAEANTQQLMIVTALTGPRTSTDTPVTVRAVGASTISAVTGPAVLVPCGNTLVDGGNYPDAKGIRPIRKSNTTTTKSASVEISHAADKANLYHGPQYKMNRELQIKKFRADMERDLLHSKYAVIQNFTQTNSNGSRTGDIRFTRGVFATVSSRVDTYSGPLTEDTWDEFMFESCFPDAFSGSSTKLAFFGNLAAKNLHKDLKNKMRILNGPASSKYGLQIREYENAAGNSLLIFVEKNFFGISPYEKGVMVLDPKFMWLRQYGQNLMEIYDTSPPRQAVRSMSIEAAYGLELQFERAHAVLKQAS